VSEPIPANSGPEPPEPEGRAETIWLRFWQKYRAACVAAAVILAFVLGYWLAARRAAPPAPAAKAEQPGADRILYWSCSMHPQIKMPDNKSKCPICFMDLTAVREAGGGGGDAPRLVLSKAARERAEIQTSPVEYRPLAVTVRMVGKIEYDETRLAHISAWVGGRIDRLFVDYAGIRVRKGDHLAEIYSPDLRTVEEEYLIALRRAQAAKKGSDADETASAEAIRSAARKKLELWGVLPAQIEELERTGRTSDRMTIYSPIGGTVIEREAFAGKYVMMGERLFTIAGLDVVWAMLDAYEIDLKWIHYGEAVEFETDAYPGQLFKGRIAFVSPILNEMTRTVKVRVNVPNPDGRLRPGMYVRAKLDVTLDEAGRVRNNAVAGKWMCPMHPEIIKDKPDKCDNCGMDLEETEKLGFSRLDVPAKRVLSIPATAPLLTGKRAVVYVEERKGDEVAYVGREVELGDRAGEYYIVNSGLAEGERVVTKGNFKIDSALQIMAKPSMMKPQEGEGTRGEGRGEEPAQKFPPVADVQPALDAYLALVDALAADDASKGGVAIAALKATLDKAEGKGLEGHAQHQFKDLLAALKKAAAGDPPKGIAEQRDLLGGLTKPLTDYLRAFNHGLSFPLAEAYCSMAFKNRGGTWFQKGAEVRNPYFGAAMLKCGEVKRELKPGTRDEGRGARDEGRGTRGEVEDQKRKEAQP